MARCAANSRASLCRARCADCTQRRTNAPRPREEGSRGPRRSSLRTRSGATTRVPGTSPAAAARRRARAAALFASARRRCASVSVCGERGRFSGMTSASAAGDVIPETSGE